MKTLYSLRTPLVVLLALAGLWGVSLAWSVRELPPRVASHFNAEGTANGWMDRDSYVLSMGATGLLSPLFLLGIGLVTALLPSESMNLPHREYWLSPERRGDTQRYLSRHMAWLACATMSLLLALHWLIVEANRAVPVRLSNTIWLLVAAFLGVVVSWLVVMIRHFSQPTPQAS